MNPQLVYELVGYLASVLVAISLMMSSIIKLRLINLAGSLVFTVYGVMIGAYPVAAVNAFITLINLYYLYQIFLTREYFNLMEAQPSSRYLQHFLEFYSSEIQRFNPGFRYQPVEGEQVYFVLRNMAPAGVFIAGPEEGDVLPVKLDFVIPGYRDFKVARYVFLENGELFRKRGIRTICSQPGSPAHTRYLRRMGFKPAEDTQQAGGQVCYCLSLG
jgi:hypothetical protein